MTASLEEIERTAVVGAGQMGRGIAAVSALGGYEVALCDIDEDQLEAAMEEIEWSLGKAVEHDRATDEEKAAAMDRIETYTETAEGVSDAQFVTEAAPENQDLKGSIFEDIDEHAPEEAILATNTSGLNITRIAEVTDRPEQVCGTHWFNPPMLMELVEVIETEHVDPDVADTAEAFIEGLGKTPIRCRMDIPSFIVNRLMRPYGRTAVWYVQWEEAGIEEVDSAMKYKAGFPMGPFELADYTGSIQLSVEAEEGHLTDDRPLKYDTPVPDLIHEKYEQGHYGRKSGKGYYDYSEQDQPVISEAAGEEFDPLRIWAPTINEAAKLVQHDVASVEDIDTGAKLGGNWPTGPLEKADEVGLEPVIRECTRFAARHEDIREIDHALPCDLLFEMAREDETFY
jgi:enoyl-CoA hydratase/3-hydroxyacyl-CoA dehydrogenase